jgi:hypothetical protein
MNGKLLSELIPKSCSFSNVRSILSKKYWDLLRKQCYDEANNKCEICNETGKQQGFKHDVECHEIWEYDDKTNTQILISLIALCVRCHQVKHFGRTSAIGQQANAFKHMEKVNNWTHKECLSHLAESMQTYKKRSKKKWKINLDVLSSKYGVPTKIITEANNKERVTKIKFKKKKK